MLEIRNFSGGNGFLSNFSASPITVDGKVYPTVEHAFQAHKTVDPEWRERIRTAPTPGAAKRLGRKCPRVSNWDTERVNAMRYFLQLKFQEPGLRDRLLATGDAILIEGNTWGDTFWGVCGGVGENMLGKLLMEIRDAQRS